MARTKKTAVSLDESVFEQADILAAKRGMSRSRLYETALRAFIEEDENRSLLRDLDAAYAEGPTPDELDRLAAARRSHRRQVEGEWK